MSETNDVVLYRCTECGKESVSMGWLHAHIEAKHTGFGPFNLIPNPFALGNFDRDMTMTEVLRATDPEQVTIDEVDDVE
ncbi:MAG: hypothetical protein HQRvContig04_44 [Haloquadratum phage sp.]|nr:MAG: hypothetical protein HQRvContig04_44 [Haloquadratum phage sp.]